MKKNKLIELIIISVLLSSACLLVGIMLYDYYESAIVLYCVGWTGGTICNAITK